MIIWNKKNNGKERGDFMKWTRTKEKKDLRQLSGNAYSNCYLLYWITPQSPNEQDDRELPMPSQRVRGRIKIKIK